MKEKKTSLKCRLHNMQRQQLLQKSNVISVTTIDLLLCDHKKYLYRIEIYSSVLRFKMDMESLLSYFADLKTNSIFGQVCGVGYIL